MGQRASTRRSRLRSIRSALPIYTSAFPPFANQYTRERSRKRPTTDRTRDALADPLDAGLQAAHAADDHVDLHAALRRAVQRANDRRIRDRVVLDDHVCRPSCAGVLDLAIEQRWRSFAQPLDALVDRCEQIELGVVLDFLHLHIRVANDAEQMGVEDVDVREQRWRPWRRLQGPDDTCTNSVQTADKAIATGVFRRWSALFPQLFHSDWWKNADAITAVALRACAYSPVLQGPSVGKFCTAQKCVCFWDPSWFVISSTPSAARP